jgi:predicted MFS family arabinose efflux permease
VTSPASEWTTGWTSVLGSISGMMIVAAASSVIGIVMSPISAEFGWSRAEIAGSVLIVSLCALFCAPVCGNLIGRFGPRKVALLSLVATACGFCLIAASGGPVWTWFAAWVLFGLLSSALGPIVWTSAISNLFDRHRGLALSIALSGSGLAYTVLPPLVAPVVAHYGWRGVYLALALLTLLVVLPLNWLLLRERTSQVRSQESAGELSVKLASTSLTLGEALHNRRFWQLSTAMLIIAAVVGSLVIHFFPMLRELDVTVGQATYLTAAIGPAMIIGRMLTGYLVDRIFAPAVMASAAALPILTCLVLWTESSSPRALLLGAIALGISAGGIGCALAYLVSRYFGLAHYASIFGLLIAAFGVGFGLAPVISGHIFDVMRTYSNLYLVFALMLAPACILIATLGRYNSPDGKPSIADSAPCLRP